MELTHQASLESYILIRQELNQRQEQVLNTLKLFGEKGATMHQVAAEMGVPLHTISPRFSELRKAGLIKAIRHTEEGEGRKKTIFGVVR